MRLLAGAALLPLLLALSLVPQQGDGGGSSGGAIANGCITCHAGIEEIHPGYQLTCVDCHGGNAAATTKEQAHVLPQTPPVGDERVLGQFQDLAWQQFRNPTNLRVAQKVCGDCHERVVGNVLKGLHSTTCGHLGDGFYEHGLTNSKTPNYSVFPVVDEDGDVPPGCLKATVQIPAPNTGNDKDHIETHYADLPRKACMHCHLWSQGRAVRGRVGMDGDYRGEGCAACHVTYAEDGRSRSADATIDKLEPGHPLQHRFTSKIPTSTCTHCHYGDASIGLSFRGMAQLVPGMPAGPDVPGTTDKLLNGTFYIQDPDLTPPDVHHQRGMHCIDCHTAADTMGDGNIHPQMDHAVEIECTSCHGTFEQTTDLLTSHGRRVPNLERDGDKFWLRSKVTGKRHPVVQVAHLVDPKHPDYSERAAAAMNSNHGRLECYACHAGWNVNFFGFHFDRNEQFTQLDLLSGRRTPGRVTTQEKVFATFNQLRLGWNHEGRIAPYMVGFSTIGSFRDDKGQPFLRQALPATAAGLSGVTLVPHQTHTTRPEPRSCAECHRSPATWGLGSTNFRLLREFAFALTPHKLHSVAMNGRQLAQSQPIAEIGFAGDGRALALRSHPATARTTHAYVATADGTLRVFDAASPVALRELDARKLLRDPHQLVVQGDYLFAADGTGGVMIFDLGKPERPRPLGTVPTVQARGLALSWPWLLVADGPGGLLVLDVADPAQPRVLAELDLNAESAAPNDASSVALLFQYSRTKAADPLGEQLERSAARHLAFVACGLDGVRIVDFTDPAKPQLLHGRAQEGAFRSQRGDVHGVAVNTQFDLGSQGGGIRSAERDYLFVMESIGNDDNRQQRVRAFDVSDPLRPRAVAGNQRVYGGTGRLEVIAAYNEPFLQHFVVASGAGGLGTVLDASKMPTGLQPGTVWDDLRDLRDLQFERMPFDRLQDERGRWEKDISHRDCRYLTVEEMLKVLRADVPVGREAEGRYGELQEPRKPRGTK